MCIFAIGNFLDVDNSHLLSLDSAATNTVAHIAEQ